FVLAALQCGIEKLCRGALLELQLVANASAGIHEQGNSQRKIGFTAKVRNRLRSFVFENSKIVLLEVCNEFPSPVSDGEENVDEFNVYGECLIVPDRGRRGYRFRGLLLRLSLFLGPLA